MIQPKEAITKIIGKSHHLQGETISINKSIGRILVEDVFAPIDMPPFNQSAMDGYAIRGLNNKSFIIIGEHKAGDTPNYNLKEGEAIRIFTGAIVPNTAEAVIKQEDVKQIEETIYLEKKPIGFGENIRDKGEQIKKGELACLKGTPLQAGAIGYLATLGITEVKVSKLPKINIIATGNELIEPGAPLKPGQIYESNSIMLQSAIQRENLEAEKVKIEDTAEQTYLSIKNVINDSDIVLITGGISVGNYDFVYDSLKELKVEELFYKVSQKPGKPLFVGKYKNTMIFALPGNPAAALTCFYLYVIPAIRTLQSHLTPELLRTTAKLTSEFFKKGTLSHHLKGKVFNDKVEILPKQSSAMLGDFTDANCIVILPNQEKLYKKGDSVEILHLPY